MISLKRKLSVLASASNLNGAFYLAFWRPMYRKRKKRFDIGQYQKELKKMKKDNIQALVGIKVDKENKVLELRKTTEKLSNKIAYRKRKVGINSRCSDGSACNIYE